MIPRYLIRVTAVLLGVACSGNPPPPPREAPPPRTALAAPQPDAFAHFATDYVEDALCERLAGRFVPLPDPSEKKSGTSGGGWLQGPAAGRLWVTDCRLARRESFVDLELRGVGWVWVDEAEKGNRLRQYVGLRVELGLRGVVTPAYDAASRVMTLWFEPAEVRASGAPVGEVKTSADSFGNKALRFVTLGYAGEVADRRAREKVQERLRQRFEEALSGGFTITYNLRTKQVDFALGHLPRGREPSRGFSDGRAWLANEHVLVHPAAGGFHVLGPFEPAAAVDVDFSVPGAPVRYWAECADVTTQRFAGLLRDGTLPSREATAWSSRLVQPGGATVRLSMPSCRWYLLATAADEPATASIRVRAKPRVVLDAGE